MQVWPWLIGAALLAVAADARAPDVRDVRDELARHKHQLQKEAQRPWRPADAQLPPPPTATAAATPTVAPGLVPRVVGGAVVYGAKTVGYTIGTVQAVSGLVYALLASVVSTLVYILSATLYPPWAVSRNAASVASVYLYELGAPVRYVAHAFYLLFVRWPMHALSSVMHIVYQAYVILGVAVILGALLGAGVGVLLCLENRLYVARLPRERPPPRP